MSSRPFTLPHPDAYTAEFRALAQAAAAASSRATAPRKRLVLRVEVCMATGWADEDGGEEGQDEPRVVEMPASASTHSLVYTGPADPAFGWETDVVQRRLHPIIMDAHANMIGRACFDPFVYPGLTGDRVQCACGRVTVTGQIDGEPFVFPAPDMPLLERAPLLVVSAASSSFPPPTSPPPMARAPRRATPAASSAAAARPISPSTGLPTWRSKTTNVKQILAEQTEQKAKRFEEATAAAAAAQPAAKRHIDLSQLRWTTGNRNNANPPGSFR